MKKTDHDYHYGLTRAECERLKDAMSIPGALAVAPVPRGVDPHLRLLALTQWVTQYLSTILPGDDN